MSISVSQAVGPIFSVVPSREVAVLQGAALALAETDSLHEIKKIRDKAEAVRKYAQTAALGHAVQNDAAEL